MLLTRPGRRTTSRRAAVSAGLAALFIAVASQACAEAANDASPESTQSTQSNKSAESKTQIVMLGTGTPLAEPQRSGPSIAIIVADTAYLIDFGPGVVRQASQAAWSGITALKPLNLGFAFATHLHSDHTTGLADLLLAPWTLGRRQKLELFGPPGIEAMARHIESAYAEDIKIRIGPLAFSPPEGSGINAHEVAPGVIFETPEVRVEAFAVEHGSWKHAYGYRFDTADRSIVISGDTRPSETLVAKAKGCDVLIHEAYLTRTFDTLNETLRNYHGSNHTSAIDLGKLAARVEPGLLIVYHSLRFGGSKTEVVQEIKQHFRGKVVFAEDLDTF